MKKKAAVVSEMDADEIADLLRQMDKKERETLTELLDEEIRHKIDLIDSFDEEQIRKPDVHQLCGDSVQCDRKAGYARVDPAGGG